ncbi:MAG: cation-translocating P-type ATPase [Phyllobacterium sp.]
MSCCAANVELAALPQTASPEELQLASRSLGNGLRQLDLSVPGVHCGLCIQTIERALDALPGIEYCRVNLSSRRVAIRWKDDGSAPSDIIDTLRKLGYEAHIFELGDEKDETLSRLLIALAVAGFATSNVMLLSVSVWSGADAATRDLFHWISALIALPTLLFSGRIFYQSAWSAIRSRRLNMDVPISLAISLAFLMSLFETIHHGQHAYFDASVSLLFFLLIGRTLDHMMRERARSAVRGLSQLAARGAVVIGDNGERDYLPVSEIKPMMRIILAAGERVPVDARVEEGRSELDCSIASGESMPLPVGPGSDIRAGTLNLSGALVIRATAASNDSFLAEMVRLMEVAEGGRARYRRLADRAAELYSPAVHLTAFLAFLGWMIATGDWYRSIYIAIATLIITCPCALGLAVPIVQVVAARRLFENGIMIKDGSAMERLAEIDTVVFDKTGTLTLGQPWLIDTQSIPPRYLELAAELSLYSRHPLSRALALFSGQSALAAFDRIEEHPGSGIEAAIGADTYRLGRREWITGQAFDGSAQDGPQTCLAINGKIVQVFSFEDRPRADAAIAIAELKRRGLQLAIISGDRIPAVQKLASALGIDTYCGEVLPADKAALVRELSDKGSKVLMVGDGLNDAPALVAAYVSMAPATAADIGRNAADFVFLRESLSAAPLAIAVSREAGKLIRQNFALSIGYNFLAVPIAVMGYVTPLVAALAMSLSSIIVVSNALRLKAGKTGKKQADTPARLPASAVLKGARD